MKAKRLFICDFIYEVTDPERRKEAAYECGGFRSVATNAPQDLLAMMTFERVEIPVGSRCWAFDDEEHYPFPHPTSDQALFRINGIPDKSFVWSDDGNHKSEWRWKEAEFYVSIPQIVLNSPDDFEYKDTE